MTRIRIIPFLLGLALASPALLSAEEFPLITDTRELLGFESEADLAGLRLNSSQAVIVTEGASAGQKALRLTFEPPAAYPSVNFTQATPVDWRGYGGLAFDAYNPGTDTVAFGIRVDSSEKADGNGNHSRSGKGSVDGGQRVTFVLPFGVDPASLGMKSLPGFGDYRSMGNSGTGPFDLGHIVTWQLFMGRQQSALSLVVDNVRLVPGQKQDFNGLVDDFGQYTKQDWPGKIHSVADFAAQKEQEEKDLAQHPRSPGRNHYGGWAEGPQLKATGFFRVEKYRDKWSFVDPEGRLFLSFGPTGLGTSENTILKGRENLFSVLPEADPVLAAAVSKDGKHLDFRSANLRRKYGEDFKAPFYARSYERFISWGCNTIGAFSSWDSLRNGKVPYTATLWPADKHARLATGKEQVRAMHDPYDPQFAVDVAGAVQAQASRIGDDPFFIGYFLGNEEHWGYWRGGPRSHYELVLAGLKLKATESPAKRAFLKQLNEKYAGDLTKLNAAWGTKFADWSTMEAPVQISDEVLPEGMKADFSLLLTHLADQYFRVVNEQIKAADPHHLYIGCRFAGFSPEVLAGAAKHSDVLSFNLYRLEIDPRDFTFLDDIDKPVVIGEFHFGATDRGMFDVGIIGVADQASRGKAYQRYVRSVLAHPKFIGAHWFQYSDQAPTGRAMDGENGNVGLVSITDTPFPELISAMREIHGEMYEVRFGK